MGLPSHGQPYPLYLCIIKASLGACSTLFLETESPRRPHCPARQRLLLQLRGYWRCHLTRASHSTNAYLSSWPGQCGHQGRSADWGMVTCWSSREGTGPHGGAMEIFKTCPLPPKELRAIGSPAHCFSWGERCTTAPLSGLG